MSHKWAISKMADNSCEKNIQSLKNIHYRLYSCNNNIEYPVIYYQFNHYILQNWGIWEHVLRNLKDGRWAMRLICDTALIKHLVINDQCRTLQFKCSCWRCLFCIPLLWFVNFTICSSNLPANTKRFYNKIQTIDLVCWWLNKNAF